MDKHIETLNIMESSYAHVRKSDSEFEAIEAAKEALQEQAERGKGCEWCNSDALESIAVTHIFNLPKIAINTGGGVDESEKVRFCPHCGKRLK